jgi:tRNA (uracil-5-)-methyltransferase TRM9
MQPDTSHRLIELNRQFYQTFAQPFSITRQRLQPGVRRILDQIPVDANVVDLGCGNGELWRALLSRGFLGRYVGLDFSDGLLQAARERLAPVATLQQPTFLQADLADPGWVNKISNTPITVAATVATAFAVLHHLPGIERRAQFLQQVRSLLAPDGRLFLSNWQYLNSERLRARIQPWATIGLDDEQVDPGDNLLDWRRGGYGLRYVHHFTETELVDLARASGFRILEAFYSDGEGGRLSLYQVWEPLKQ